MAAFGIVQSALPDSRYLVAPEYDFKGVLDCVSIQRNTFTVGERVKIVQIGAFAEGLDEYGILSEASELRGVQEILPGFKGVIASRNPANNLINLLCRLANKTKMLFARAIVRAPGANGLYVEYIDGIKQGTSEDLPIMQGLEGFRVEEIVVVNDTLFGSPFVVGWWEAALNVLLKIGERHGLCFYDGELWAWGRGSVTGDGTSTNRPTPYKYAFENVVDFDAGPLHSVIVYADGTVYSTGLNYWGQLGNGTILDSLGYLSANITDVSKVFATGVGGG